MKTTTRAWLRAALTALFTPFVLWLFIYGMPLSGVHAALGWRTLLPRPMRWPRLAWLIWLGAPISVMLIGLPEYAETTRSLHCRALAAGGRTLPAPCTPEDVSQAQEAMRSGAPLYSRREQLGVHGFNVLLAMGGVVAGFPEVAWETLRMSWTPSTLGDSPVASDRKAQCKAGYPGGHRPTQSAERSSDFAMRSAKTRAVVATLRDRLMAQGPLADGESREAGPEPLKWYYPAAADNNGFYGRILLDDSLRVALALVTPDGAISARAHREGERTWLDLRWTGSIGYPAEGAFELRLPGWTLGGGRTLWVSEASFCGMYMDGAMAPYTLSYRWTVPLDDPRLSASERGQTHRAWMEAALRWLALR